VLAHVPRRHLAVGGIVNGLEVLEDENDPAMPYFALDLMATVTFDALDLAPVLAPVPRRHLPSAGS